MYNRIAYNRRQYNGRFLITRLIADVIAVADAISQFTSYLRTITESISLSQTVSRIATFYRTIYDNIVTTDTIVRRVLNKLGSLPTILSASTKRFFAGSSKVIRPKRS